MSRKHAFVSVVLALNAVIGTVALTRTVHLGVASHEASSRLIATRTARLDKFEASLKAQLAQKPPSLPKKSPLTTASAPATSATANAPRVRYVRPAPIIIHKHRAGGETESEDSAAGDGEVGGDD
jgi:hypothetical protein